MPTYLVDYACHPCQVFVSGVNVSSHKLVKCVQQQSFYGKRILNTFIIGITSLFALFGIIKNDDLNFDLANLQWLSVKLKTKPTLF